VHLRTLVILRITIWIFLASLLGTCNLASRLRNTNNCSVFLADLTTLKEKHTSKCEELDMLRVEVVELKSRAALLGA
jgi:hypothetical protein